MVKCMYRSQNTNTCGRSTSVNHCEIVTDAICGGCVVYQTTPTVNDKTRFKRIMREAVHALEDSNTIEALRILNEGLKI